MNKFEQPTLITFRVPTIEFDKIKKFAILHDRKPSPFFRDCVINNIERNYDLSNYAEKWNIKE